MKIVMGCPSPKQRLFLNADAANVIFGGARGGGKSWAVRYKAKTLGFYYPGIKMLIVRRTYPELIKNHIRTLRQELLGAAKYNDKDKQLTFCNGSIIDFMYCSRDGDLDRLQGCEYDVIFLDEATQLSEYQIKTITACCRGANDFPRRIYYTCNPGGQSHAYFRRLIDRRFEEQERPEDYLFIQSLVTDNKALMDKDPTYLQKLEALPPKLREAWLYGRWDIFEGQFFEDFRDDPAHYEDRRNTHVIAPFAIPAGWKIYRSFDWGYRRPFSCGYWAVDYEGTLYRILEVYGCTGEPNEGLKMPPSEVFAKIHGFETEHPWLKGRKIHGVADPAIWDAEYGESIAQTAEKCRVYFEKGDHQRIPGWMQCHYRLAFDADGYPGMYVFSTCKDFIRTIPTLMYDDHRVEDLNTEGEDHIADEWRYMCMARPIKPRYTEDKERRRAKEPWQLALDIDTIPKARSRAGMEVLE